MHPAMLVYPMIKVGLVLLLQAAFSLFYNRISCFYSAELLHFTPIVSPYALRALYLIIAKDSANSLHSLLAYLLFITVAASWLGYLLLIREPSSIPGYRICRLPRVC